MTAPSALRLALLLCSALVLHASHAAAACDGMPLASGSQAIEVDGVRRTFLVRTSSAYDGHTAAPVVITFHPFGMNAQYMQGRVSTSRTWPEAVTVHAEAIAGDGAPAAWQTPAETARNRDLRYVDAILAWLGAEACVDPDAVFVLGYSNGAQFAGLLACERRDRIAAAAMAAGRLPCAPADAMPVMLSHGLGDRTVPYTEAVTAVRTWSAVNSCAAPPQAGAIGCAAADSCDAAAVILCTHRGGHEYDVSFTARAIEFFRGVVEGR